MGRGVSAPRLCAVQDPFGLPLCKIRRTLRKVKVRSVYRRCRPAGLSARRRMDDRGPGLRRRLVPGGVERQGDTSLHPRPEAARQGCPRRQATVPPPQPDRVHVRSASCPDAGSQQAMTGAPGTGAPRPSRQSSRSPLLSCSGFEDQEVWTLGNTLFEKSDTNAILGVAQSLTRRFSVEDGVVDLGSQDRLD